MSNRIPAATFIDVIRNCSGRAVSLPTRPYAPQFALFLGAGASRSSGVCIASEIVRLFRERFAQQNPSVRLEDTSWYREEEAYSTLFEHLFPSPTLRRDYVERLLEFASPSFGYLYAVRLIEEGFFNTVFTTNFDDLLNEACYLFSADVRPMTCAHDSSVRFARLTSPRPKILKLHGDFLYDNIRNTSRERESLEQNMRDKFSQYAGEFGLLVIGYSGNDRSVMDILEELMLNRQNFPQGVFWCLPRGETPGPRVSNLSHLDRFHLVEIESFDGFMAELHESLARLPHPVVDNPYRALGLRLARILNSLPHKTEAGNLHPILQRDLISLGNAVRDPQKQSVMPKPHNCMAVVEVQSGNYDQAAGHVLSQLKDLSSTIAAVCEAFRIGIHLVCSGDVPAEFGGDLLEALESSGLLNTYPQGLSLNQRVVELIRGKKAEFALKLLDLVHSKTGFEDDWAFINRIQLMLRSNQKPQESQRLRLRELSTAARVLTRFGALVADGKNKRAVDELSAAVDETGHIEGQSVGDVCDWPICELLSQRQRRRLAALCVCSSSSKRPVQAEPGG